MHYDIAISSYNYKYAMATTLGYAWLLFLLSGAGMARNVLDMEFDEETGEELLKPLPPAQPMISKGHRIVNFEDLQTSIVLMDEEAAQRTAHDIDDRLQQPRLKEPSVVYERGVSS